MKLVYKSYIGNGSTNATGTVNGEYLFGYADVCVLTFLSEALSDKLGSVNYVTSSANIKFLAPAYAYGYLEGYAEFIDISPAKFDVRVLVKYREKGTPDWVDCLSGELSFSLIKINKDGSRILTRIPKEIMNEIKR